MFELPVGHTMCGLFWNVPGGRWQSSVVISWQLMFVVEGQREVAQKRTLEITTHSVSLCREATNDSQECGSQCPGS